MTAQVFTRRALLLAAPVAAFASTHPVWAADPGGHVAMPPAEDIQRRLEREITVETRLRKPLEVVRFDPRLRRRAPSIDIYAIRFPSGQAAVPLSEMPKVEEIATALERILLKRGYEVFLLEGHTDSAGSRRANAQLSYLRAYNLATTLVRTFGISRRAVEPVGFGEDEPLAHTPDWKNRRVTIRRITDFVA
ncbi:MAG: OmpA family protein [Rhizobiaceae bacterium]|jgi:outer membrane protein OmpA-like peptidoglycan-associated protein|nr:OmpA family protein [Rhizobiaceae bacterium]